MRALRLCVLLVAALPAVASCRFFLPDTTLRAGPDLLTFSDIRLVGGFRLSDDTYGDSNVNYAQGPIAYNAVHHSLFVIGHAHHQAVSEFPIPASLTATAVADMPISEPVQDFARLLPRGGGAEQDSVDRIGALAVVETGDAPQLVYGVYRYYDAGGTGRATTGVLSNIDDLAGSPVSGFSRMAGGPGHTAGWLSPVPAAYRQAVGADYFAGHASGIPIISRCSVGPTAFAVDSDALLAAGADDDIATTALMDFSLGNVMSDRDLPDHAAKEAYLHNRDPDTGELLGNHLWTHNSRGVYGVLLPGTRTYLVVGSSAGHRSGIGYKITQDDGSECGGYCAYSADDSYGYYWMFDVDDLLAVKAGDTPAHEVLPYHYGEFPAPSDSDSTAIIGGTIDADSRVLYLSWEFGDRTQGRYSRPPLIAAYRWDQVP